MTPDKAIEALFNCLNICNNDILVTHKFEENKKNILCSNIHIIRCPDIIIPFSYGLALSNSNKRIISIQNMNSAYNYQSCMRNIKKYNIKNLITVIVNNDKHINFKKAALYWGYENSFMVNSVDSLAKVIDWLNDYQKYPGSRFLEIRCNNYIINNVVSDKNLKLFIEKWRDE